MASRFNVGIGGHSWSLPLALVFCLLSSGAVAGELDFELYELTGKLYSSQQVRGRSDTQYLVVDFFSLDCKPCKEAIPEWIRLHNEYEKQGLSIVLVALRRESSRAATEAVKAYFRANPVPFPVVIDKYGLVAKQFHVIDKGGAATLPKIFLLNSEGKKIIVTDETGAIGKLPWK